MKKSDYEGFALLADILKNIARPRITFDIIPQDVIPNLLDVVIKNSGYTPGYHISFKFKDDLYYHEKSNMSDIPLFKKPIPFLSAGHEIRFFYGNFPEILARGGALGKKRTTVTIQYTDINEKSTPKFTDVYEVDVERYKDILSISRQDINSLVKEVSSLRRGVERMIGSGLLVKTLQDQKNERQELLKRYIPKNSNDKELQ